MLKKILILLLCTNLYATEQADDTVLPKIAMIVGMISLGVTALTIYSSDTEGSAEIADHVELGITILAGAASAFAAAKLYPIGKEVYSAIFPTEGQRAIQDAKIIASRKRLSLLKAEEQFRNCLLSCNSNSPKNASGIPTICEEAARMFSMLGAQSEVDRMIDVFNKYEK